uniref:Zinc finger, CCHC-type n=1 Tax=Tanacetum cinerariifolium TaxID=118510 RepID=A0A6L2L951_TANCI|nr:zinc finger, CCHC-type [Tanacetum cinerariifolium]
MKVANLKQLQSTLEEEEEHKGKEKTYNAWNYKRVVEIGLCGHRFDKYRHKGKERKLSGNILWKTNSSRQKRGKHQREEQVSNAERIGKVSFGCGQKSKSTHEKGILQKLLDSTPDRFIQIVASIEKTNDLDDITLDEIVGKLKAFEERIKLQKGGQVESHENLLFAHGEHTKRGRRFGNRGGRSNFSRGNLQRNRNKHDSKEEGSTHKEKSNTKWNKREWDMSKIQCHKCGKLGHFRKNCKESSTTQEQSNLILEEDEASLLMATHETKHEETFSTFKEFRQRIEIEMRMKLRMLRTDRGGEFTSNEFTKYCKENGIARQLTAPYSPQQNGVVERRNRIVLSTTRSMMKEMKLPLTFWAEAVRHAIYILNRVPTRAMEDKTPYEALYSRKPNLENLRIFGCTAYAKITIPHLKKLDDRSIPMIYLGVEEGSKACRLYDPKGKRIHVRRDVRFMETKTWDRDNNGKETSIQDTFWASFMVEGVDNENPTPINTENNDNTYQEQEPIIDPDSPITTPAYTYNPNSEEEEVYVTQPEGFIQQGNSGKVYKLTKALYGLRQALRAWNMKLDQTLKSLDFKKCNLKQAVYTKRSKTSTLIVGVYVDDLIITGTPRKELETRGEITIKQTGYINKILKETSMMDSNDTKIPMNPGTNLVKAEDGNSVDTTYYISLIGSLRIIGYSDSSYRITTNQGKGTTGIVFYFGELPITWCTQKQPTVALSSCESEFMAATRATCQALWLKRLLSELTG